MKECPFKYKENIVESTEESISNPITSQTNWWKVTGTYDACKLMKSGNNECIGEDKCPIYKRKEGGT